MIKPPLVEYEALLERCGAAVAVLDETGAILRANADACRLIGCRADATGGCGSLAGTRVPQELIDLLSTARANGMPAQREIRTPDGGVSLLVSISRIESPSGGPRYLMVGHNVTELRRLEKVRRDFVANVSHELRTPLASIRAMAETLQDGALEDPSVAGHFLNTIITEAERLTRISEDLLVLSDAESRTPERKRFSMSDLIGEMAARLTPQAEKAGILIETDVPARLEVLANPDQMEQVILNLVDNAIKYTPAGGRAEIRAERLDDRIAVHVTDSGIGIQPGDLPRIFERFYRIDKARSRQSGGTGLGLSIVKHIVESHGGAVTVESEFGRGSTFTFTVPLPVRK